MDGILIVDKPAGPTSHDIVALIRRLAATKRVGHGGTLDPFASGVLPVFLGRATRMVEYQLGDPKSYRATICFGASSTTDDLDGELSPVDGPTLDRAAVEAALAAAGAPRMHAGPYLNEFVVRVPDAATIHRRLLGHGVLAGLPLAEAEPDEARLADGLLVCATEVTTREEIDLFAWALGEELGAGSAAGLGAEGGLAVGAPAGGVR